MSTTTRNKARATTIVGPAADRFELRRKVLRRRWWLKVAAIGLVLGLLAGAAWAVLTSSLLGVSSVEVVGAHRTSVLQIEQAAAVPLGRPLARLDLGAIQQRVAGLTSIASVAVTRSFPHTLRITVVERTPIAVAGPSFGPFRLVDAAGVDLGRTATRPKGLPLIVLDPASADLATFRAAAAVAAALPAALAGRVDSISATSADGVALLLSGGAKVRWGGSDRSVDKAQVLAVLLTHPAKVYDVSAPDAPTTTG